MDTLLVVIDYQNDFVTGALGTKEAQALLPALNERLRTAGRIAYTLDSHGENYPATREGRALPVPHCLRGSWGHAPADGLELPAGSVCIEKPTFGSTLLGEYVRNLYEAGEIGAVELAGVCTDICVISNALLLRAFCPELPIAVNARLCAGVTPQSHDTALRAMRACQIEILE